jgi:hypothetical protein
MTEAAKKQQILDVFLDVTKKGLLVFSLMGRGFQILPIQHNANTAA